ncbi:sterol carrier protein domain-containing protein [Mesorhizobium sp. M0959]|uniref:alkyl sulfatase C-terminal domain-containing protein n=1 Tax=Mesorhizobium sp. M0959 TaxID=2957034 RepID=UPI00333DB6F0
MDGETCATSEGSANAPAAVFTMNAEALNRIFLGEVTAAQAIKEGTVHVAGDAEALARFQHMFPPPEPLTA